MWHDIFVAGVPLLERVVRAALIYVFAVVALRVAGKRELGQLSTFDLVVLLFFSNILQNAVIGADNSVTGGVVGATTFLALNYLVARLTYNHERLDALVEGTPTTLVVGRCRPDGQPARELVSEDDLKAACRRQGIRDLGRCGHGRARSGWRDQRLRPHAARRHPGAPQAAASVGGCADRAVGGRRAGIGMST